jgi:thimet oligopeptidase
VRRTRAAATGALFSAFSAVALAAAPPPGASGLMTVTPSQFLEACRADMAQARSGMNTLKTLKAGPAGVLDTYDKAQWHLSAANARASLGHETHPDAALREAAEKCDQETQELNTEFSLDRAVYDALAAIDPKGLEPAGRYYLERTLLGFRLAGVDRDEPTGTRVKQIDGELVKLSQEFGRNIRESVLKMEVDAADLEGLPPDYIKAHKPNDGGKVVLTTDSPDYAPFMSYAKRGNVREQYWKLARVRAPKNIPVLDQILAKRHEKAKLLGFANWADYITADKMIQSGTKAGEFIEKISVAADARLKADYAQLLERKKKDEPAATALLPWDTGYLTDRIKAEKFGVNASEVRPYFQYENVKNAVLSTTAKLFGIRYQRIADAKVWHPDVEAYDVFDGSRILGRIYLDMHPRANKYKHYAQFTLVPGKADVALPEGVLVCNFPQPKEGDPGLMQHQDVVTFFHEFGHLVHHVLSGQQKWSGAGVEWDFVEAPSQMLEEWARDPKTLQSFAIHYQTKQPIPLALAQKLRDAEEFGKGMFVRGQMSLAAISLGLHNRDPKGLDTTQFSAQQQEKYTPFKHVPGTHFQTAFGHLDGYSAIYYTYMWSLVIAKDMYSAFTAQGDIMKPDAARKYRRYVLEATGTKPAANLVQDFLGRPYAFKAYEDWLNAK